MRGFRTLFLFLIIGVLAPIICNDKPLLLIRDQHISFPFLNKVDYNESVKDWTLNALIPFSPGKSDFTNADYKSPFSTQTLKNNSLYYRHWLGTTLRGADVLAGIVEGARYSIIVAFSAALLSLLIGVIMGALSSFSSRHPFHFSILQIIILLMMILFIYNLMNYVFFDSLIKLFLIIISLLIVFLSCKYLRKWSPSIIFNFEKVETQLNILFSAIPRLFLVIAIVGNENSTMATLIFTLGITGWMEVSRLVRSEIVRIQESDFYAAAVMSGAGWKRIVIKQILPNLKPLLISVFAFAFAGVVMSEAALSFLGWGLPADQVTWGSLIMEGKESFHAWWLIVFPGICISICLFKLFSLSRKTNYDNYSL